MKKFLTLILTVFISISVTAQSFNLIATEYHPGHNCGRVTASGERIDVNKLNTGQIHWVAMSPDMFSKHGVKMYDIIEVTSEKCPHANGRWIVLDKTSTRHSKWIDFLTPRSKPLKVHGKVHVKVVGNAKHQFHHKKKKK